jgi:hypothetical protein
MANMQGNIPPDLPLSNGGLRHTTPPMKPVFCLAGDGQLVEFLVPFPMHIIEQSQWAPLQCTVSDRPVLIHKPIPIMQPYEFEGRLGNESPDAFCCIIRTECSGGPSKPYPKPAEIWTIVDLLLNWIRVKARHYWLLNGQKGFGAIFRGSVLTQEGQQIVQHNISTYGRNLIVKPLDESLWLTLANEVNNGLTPPVSESVFCDALISAVSGDEMKAFLELGVAAEIELTRLLFDTSNALPSTPQKQKFTKKGERDKFPQKLTDWPQKLGLEDPQTFNPPGTFTGWLDIVKELYKLRNSVAHSGKIRTGFSAQDIAAYLYSTNVFFDYCYQQRIKAQLPVYSYPIDRSPYGQIVVFHKWEPTMESSSAATTIS